MTVGSVSGAGGARGREAGLCCCWFWWWSHGNHSATRSQLFIFFYYLFMTLATLAHSPSHPPTHSACHTYTCVCMQAPALVEHVAFVFRLWTKDICVAPRNNKSNKRANFYEHIIEKLAWPGRGHTQGSMMGQGAWQLDQAYNCRRFFGLQWTTWNSTPRNSATYGLVLEPIPVRVSPSVNPSPLSEFLLIGSRICSLEIVARDDLSLKSWS